MRAKQDAISKRTSATFLGASEKPLGPNATLWQSERPRNNAPRSLALPSNVYGGGFGQGNRTPDNGSNAARPSRAASRRGRRSTGRHNAGSSRSASRRSCTICAYVDTAFVDQGYTGESARAATEEEVIHLHVVRLEEAGVALCSCPDAGWWSGPSPGPRGSDAWPGIVNAYRTPLPAFISSSFPALCSVKPRHCREAHDTLWSFCALAGS